MVYEHEEGQLDDKSETEIIILHEMELSSDQICQAYFLAWKLRIKLFPD